ncbi:MAG: shikimate dehydrogenase, partial [Planctomycetes bacterium]|nr:shikimate dehydrogenase [Planctomycetota bacterium]
MSHTLLCVSLTTETAEQTLAALHAPSRAFDVAEVRLDYVRDPDVRRLLEGRPCPVIITCRPVREGGRWAGDEGQRIELLEEADRLGADFVDVELEALPRFRRQGRARIIVSYHNFQETPAEIEAIASRMEHAEADIVKVATHARSLLDNLAAFRVLRAARKPTIAVMMGEHGHVSRVLGPKFGAFLVYAAPEAGREAAPGQVPVRDMLDLYGFRRIGPATRVHGVIANPVAHSMSPAIHNAAFRECGVDAVYLPFRVDDPAGFIPAFRELPVEGYSVTIPHKQAVIPLLDEVQPLARRIGAVNTIVRRDGRLCGSNADWSAAVKAIESGLQEGEALEGKTVLLLGAGGAARAMAFGLAERGASVAIANRTHDRAVRLAAEVGCEAIPLSSVGSVAYDILVNGTSLGMHPGVEETPLHASLLRREALVFDSVYNPLETRLLREARAAGCRTVNGLEMFVNQAVEQFELWTRLPAPRAL